MVYARLTKVQKPTFVVKVADLDRGAKTVTWPIPVPWLESTLEGTDAKPKGDEGVLEVELSKNDDDVLVRGHARVNVVVPCVVTLDPLPFELEPEIFLMLGRAPAPAPVQRAGRAGRAGRGGKRKAAATPATPPRAGRGRPKGGQEPDEEGTELSQKEAARDVFEGDKVVLDEFLREFILLELPLYPRRSDLPPEQTPATDSPPAPEPTAPPVDPRLLPLAELRDRLQKNDKE